MSVCGKLAEVLGTYLTFRPSMAVSCFFAANASAIPKRWWKEAVVYQTYSPSFKDRVGEFWVIRFAFCSQVDYLASRTLVDYEP